MLKSYLLVGLRILWRHKTYAVVNILGLASGIAVCLVVAVIVRHSLSYDRFHEKADRIYRLVQGEMPMLEFGTPRMPSGLGAAIEDRLPGVERVTALITKPRSLFAVDEKKIYSDGILATDDQFFGTFSFTLMRGDAGSVLDEPGEVVLTESFRRQLFGDDDAIGRLVSIEAPAERIQYRVSGVMADPPANSHLQFNVLLSLSADERDERYAQSIQWGRYEHILYVVFEEQIDLKSARASLGTFATSVAPEMHLEPLTSIHLYSDPTLNGDIAVKSDVRYLYVLSGIALITLLIACVSYVNLSIAGGVHRSVEVGIRKVLGADRAQVARQFLAESALTIIISLPIAILATILVLPFVGTLVGEAQLDVFGDSSTLFALAGIVLIMGIAAASYPAFVLSGMSPSRALYGRNALVGTARRWFRNGLIGFQFFATIGLIIAALVMRDQLDFIHDQRLGVEDHVIVLEGDRVSDEDAAAFKRELERRSHVISVATGLPPGLDGGGLGSNTMPSTEETVWLKRIRGDADYIPTLDLQLIAGENFSADGPEDQGFIINQTAARTLGIMPEQIGTRTSLGSWDDVFIRGIVADFHHRTLHDPIQPLYIYRTSVESSSRGFFLVRLSAKSVAQGMAQVEEVWRRFIPDQPFDFSFLEDRIEVQYAAEQRLIQVFGAFATLAIVLACLGLYGLGAYSIERRTREMSVRKIMGASARSIYLLLSRDLLTPGLLAGVIVAPIAYLAMERWLESFAYRIDISVGVLLVSIIGALAVAWLAVTYHVLRIARVNPAEMLRYE